MNYEIILLETGFRVVSGAASLQALLEAGKAVLACDEKGTVYSITVEGNVFTFRLAESGTANDCPVVIAPIKSVTLH